MSKLYPPRIESFTAETESHTAIAVKIIPYVRAQSKTVFVFTKNSFDNDFEFDILKALEQANQEPRKTHFRLRKGPMSLTEAAKMFVYGDSRKKVFDKAQAAATIVGGTAELAQNLGHAFFQ